MALLPYFEQSNIYNSINFAVSWDAQENQTTRDTRVGTFLRPEDPPDGPPITRFFAVVGDETPFPDAVNLTFAHMKDGMSNTIMFGEVAESDTLWMEPRDLRFGTIDFRINGPFKTRGFGSPYGDSRVVFMDGSVKVLKNSTHPSVVRALVTAKGGEILEGEWPDLTVTAPVGR